MTKPETTICTNPYHGNCQTDGTNHVSENIEPHIERQKTDVGSTPGIRETVVFSISNAIQMMAEYTAKDIEDYCGHRFKVIELYSERILNLIEKEKRKAVDEYVENVAKHARGEKQ